LKIDNENDKNFDTKEDDQNMNSDDFDQDENYNEFDQDEDSDDFDQDENYNEFEQDETYFDYDQDEESDDFDQDENYNEFDQDANYDNVSMNPWKLPFANIATGLLLTTFTLNFKNLQYILPTLGILMIFFGFRSLQGVNEIFKRAWFLTIFRLILQIVQLIVLASPWILNPNYSLILGGIVTLYQIAFLLTFRNAMKLLFHDIGMKPKRDPLLRAIQWYIVFVIIVIFGSSFAILAILPMIIWLLVIISSISKYSVDLQFINYNATTVKGIKSNRCLGVGYLLLCFLFVLGTSAVSNHLHLDSSVFTPGTDMNSRARLIEMGFPEYILNDLSDENIKLFQQTTYVEAQKQQLMIDPKEEITSKSKTQNIIENVPGDINMESTTVYLEMEDGNMYVLEYFDWTDGRAYWQDGFSISGEECMELVDGKLIYDKDGIEYIAPIPRLTFGSVMVNNFFFGGRSNLQISGGVSYPFGTNHQRGYVLYRALLNEGTMYISNNMTYIHYSYPLKFPYTESVQDLMNWNSGSVQHYSNYALKAYLDEN
jgi:hypothetical protein